MNAAQDAGKRIFRVALSVPLLASSLQLFAWTSPCCTGFEAGAELLYMLPSSPQQEICLRGSCSPKELTSIAWHEAKPFGEPLTMRCHDWSWGWRVFLGFASKASCIDVRAEYTWLHQKRTTQFPDETIADGQQLFWSGSETYQLPYIPLLHPIRSLFKDLSVTGHVRHKYDAFEVQVGQRFCFQRRLWFRSFLGLHYLFLADEAKVHSLVSQPDQKTSFEDRVGLRRRSWALGPNVGLETLLRLLGNFGISARAKVGVLGGNYREHSSRHAIVAHSRTNTANTRSTRVAKDDRRHHSRSTLVPMAGARAGLSYTVCQGSCFGMTLEVGYEGIAYFNVFRRRSSDYYLHGGYGRVWFLF